MLRSMLARCMPPTTILVTVRTDEAVAGNIPSYAPLPYLRSWRALRGMTQGQLAQQSGLSVESVRRIEHGRPATVRSMGALAKALGLSLSDLVEGDPTHTIVE